MFSETTDGLAQHTLDKSLVLQSVGEGVQGLSIGVKEEEGQEKLDAAMLSGHPATGQREETTRTKADTCDKLLPSSLEGYDKKHITAAGPVSSCSDPGEVQQKMMIVNNAAENTPSSAAETRKKP